LFGVLVVDFQLGVFGLEGAVVPDGVAEAEFLVLGEAELEDALCVGAFGDEGDVGHVVVRVVFVGGEVAVEVGEPLFVADVAEGEDEFVFDGAVAWGVVFQEPEVVHFCVLVFQRVFQVEGAEHEGGGEAEGVWFLVFGDVAYCEVPVFEGEVGAPVEGSFLSVAEGPDDVVVAG